MEVRDGVEPSLRGLRPRALPLGYRTRALRAGLEPATLALTGRRTTIVLPENERVRAQGFEPRFLRSERSVLPLHNARVERTTGIEPV